MSESPSQDDGADAFADLVADTRECDHSRCDETVRVRPADEQDDHYRVHGPETDTLADVYCSASCVAAAMAGEPGVRDVSVTPTTAESREG